MIADIPTQQPVSVSKPGAQSRPLGYQQEQLYRQLFLRVQGDPRVFARAVQRAEMDADEMAAMANFVVYHLFARCDRASHPDSSGVLLLIMVVFPKMMANMDPEQLKEMQQMQARAGRGRGVP